MSEERLSSLAILHIHKHKNVDIDNVVSEFSRRNGRRSRTQFVKENKCRSSERYLMRGAVELLTQLRFWKKKIILLLVRFLKAAPT